MPCLKTGRKWIAKEPLFTLVYQDNQSFPIEQQCSAVGVHISLAKLRVRNQTRDTALADRADIADTASARNRGLLSHVRLAPGEGLWIVPCEGVHTIGMKFPIDVVFLNKKRKVLKIRREMKKWRMAMCLRGHSVLELPAGTCDTAKTAVGDQLELEKYDE